MKTFLQRFLPAFVALQLAFILVPAYSQNTPEDFSRVQESAVIRSVELANPAVVSIIISKDVPILEQELYNPFEGIPNDPFNFPFGNGGFLIPRFREKGKERKQVGGGSGFIVDSSGYILTNRHVVSDKDAEYTVFLNDERKFNAEVLAVDPSNDIAVLKIDATGLPTLEFGDSSALKLGQTAIAIGNALGEYRNTVSVGVISGLRRNITALGAAGGPEQLSGLIQSDASINPGNSGGPLLDINGKVIGMNTAIAQGAQSIGFAIPVNDVKKIYEQVRKTGKISRPYLGVRYEMTKKGALIKGDQNQPGVLPGGPAEKAGLKEGDLILKVNTRKVSLKNSLLSLLSAHSVGDTVELRVARKDKQLTITVTLEERKL